MYASNYVYTYFVYVLCTIYTLHAPNQHYLLFSLKNYIPVIVEKYDDSRDSTIAFCIAFLILSFLLV